MTGIYFSGTGNTRHCVERFLACSGGDNRITSIEGEACASAICEAELIVLGYPVYFSNIPLIVRDFIARNGALFRGKRVFIIATMGLFSGDGAGCSARLLKKHGAVIVGGLHVKMPDCIGDVSLLKRPLAANQKLIKKANEKLQSAADKLRQGKPPQEGLNALCHAVGLLGQRLWFYSKAMRYSDKLKINSELCTGCAKCAGLCPMNNIKLCGHTAVASNRCTMCYRCINTCPSKAITLLGNSVVEQCLFESYAAK